ncbi:MAG: lipooligosaccharide transport system permease protein [Pseudonocardiales bacterium]|jgi:lipooligosaccharide transport system permease protein|nr:lipooligosaccharide transport system permease protein [Pseudonocardiales bacterium]
MTAVAASAVAGSAVSGRARDAFAYWLLRYRRIWRGTIVISVANPALFLIAMGAGLGKLVDHHDSSYLHGHSYLAFLAPGLLAAAVMQTAYLESAGPVHTSARRHGNYRAALATPLAPTDLLLGHLAFIAFRIATSALAFVVVAGALRAVPPSRLPEVWASAVLTGLAFAAPVAAWAVGVERPAVLTAGFRFVIMPMYMFAGTFFSAEQLPNWLHAVVVCTPLYQGVELCRTFGLGTATAIGTLGHVAYLVALATAGVVAGRRRYTAELTG